MQKHEWYADTDARAFEVFLSRQRSMTETRERQLHPQASDREIFLRATAHRLDRETMLRVYGWCPDNAEENE